MEPRVFLIIFFTLSVGISAVDVVAAVVVVVVPDIVVMDDLDGDDISAVENRNY